MCASVDVRVREPEWFVIDLDRAAELRGEVVVEFSCRDCGETWR